MKKEINLILWVFLSLLLLNFQPRNAQGGESPFTSSTWSRGGLEVADSKKVMVLVDDLNEQAKKIGLQAGKIKTQCESRLKQAGLEASSYKPENLNINVNVIRYAFTIAVEFHRPVLFEVGEAWYKKRAVTWCTGVTGTHKGNPEYILQALDGLLDQFLKEYLEANLR